MDGGVEWGAGAASSALLLVLPVIPFQPVVTVSFGFQCFVTAPGPDCHSPPIRPGPPPGRSNSDVARFVCLNATFTLWIVAIFFLQLATRKPESENGV